MGDDWGSHWFFHGGEREPLSTPIQVTFYCLLALKASNGKGGGWSEGMLE